MKIKTRHLFIGALALTGVALGDTSRPLPPIPVHRQAGIVQAFSYRDVTLTGGPLEEQARVARDFYLALSDDSLLKGFRQRAGLPAPGKPMGGWYAPQGFAGGHSFGQYVSALARIYANTGDPRFKEKVARLVHGFHETIAPDGFFYSSLKVSTNWPCYVYDKNCIGMRDAYTLTGDREALVVLKRMTDWAYRHLPRRSDEWYTLPENLYNCYALTKDKRYLEMAREYDYSTDYYNVFASGHNAFTPQRHAYSHVNSLCSAARIYEATGDEKYFKAIFNAWEFLTRTQMYASGGWGPNERFVLAGEGKLAASLYQTKWHFHTASGNYDNDFETPCGSYANVNFDRYLLHFTGEAKYGDNMERVIFNGILAALPMQSGGRTFYYSDYHPGAQKQYFPWAWPCCSGTYAQVTADYPIDIYFHSRDTLYVNLFTPSQVRWRRAGETITVEQTTTFPASPTIAFTVHTKRPTQFDLAVRVPGWAAGPPIVLVNQRPLDITTTSDSFLRIPRVWHDGDIVTVTFSMALHFEPIDPQTPNLAALMYGPLMLVALADGEVNLHGDPAKPHEWIHARENRPLTFQTRNGKIIFRPFYQIQHEHYTTYCHIASNQIAR